MAITTPPLAATAAVDVPPTAFWRLKGFPLIPVMILLFIAFVAVFADVLAPHDPQIGSLASARPSGRQAAAWNTCWAPTMSGAMCCRG